MTLRPILSTILLSAALWLPAATVITGGGQVSFAETEPLAGDIDIVFSPCMANRLFTFSSVTLDGKVVNRTESDNIGPFGLVGGGWSGGNHLNKDMRSARTTAVKVSADGRELDINRPDTTSCRVLTVEVDNLLLMPADTVPFANEHVRYTVCGNSIEVEADHKFLCPEPVTVDRYYGMQSMFIGETEILTPGGQYGSWTPVAEVDRFTKGTAPGFTLFVEHSPDGYQAAWLDPETGLGDRHMVDDGDVVFIGNSWSKSYHKTIGGKAVKNGDSTRWHGVYSWFATPFADNCRKHSGPFSYIGALGGKRVLFTAAADGTTTQTILP